MATSAVHLELAKSYSTDSFIYTLRRFICVRGTPSKIQSDCGTQLVAAAKQVGGWDFSEIRDWCVAKKFTWELIPTGAQHQNGQAECLIGIVKKVLDSVFRNQVCTFSELSTVLHEAALIVNSRPLGIPGRAEDVEAGPPITALHLMLGRATVDAPRVCSDGPVSVAHRMQFLRDLRNQFWNKFRAMIFQGLDRSHKWRSDMRDFQQGDIVLLKQETTAAASYRLGLVGEVYPSLSDGKVRRVLVKDKNPGEKGYRVSERHANKLVLVVPTDEQSINENTETLEQVPSAQNNSEPVPFALDQMGGEDVSGQQVRDQPEDEEEELTDHAEPTHPDQDPDDAAVGTAGGTESEQSSLADGDHSLTGVNPPGGVAPRPLRHEEPSTNPDWVGRLRAARVKKRPMFYSSTDIYEH